MNKLEGMYELKRNHLPTVDWKLFQEKTVLSETCAWTIRTAVFKGQDLYLPKLFGKSGQEAMIFGRRCLQEMKDKGIVFYYPYLEAKKSGVLQFDVSSIQLECVEGDLGRLLNGSTPDAAYYWERKFLKEYGKEMLSAKEQDELLEWVFYCRRRYREIMKLGEKMQLEFSYVRDGNKENQQNRLIFFEMRTLKS